MPLSHLFHVYGEKKTPERIEPKFCLVVDVRDVMTWFKFGYDRLRGLGSAEGQSLPFPIDVDGRPYNTLTLPCERLIQKFYIVIPLIEMCGCDWFKSRHVV